MAIKLMQIPSLFFALALVIGILVQRYLDLAILPLLITLICFVLLAILQKKYVSSLLVVIFIVIGALNYKIWRDNNLEHPLKNFLPVDHVDIVSRIIDPPPLEKFNFIIEVEKIAYAGNTVKINRRFQAVVKNDFNNPMPGDRLFLKNVKIERLQPQRNPGQFDYAGYLKMRGIMAAVTLNPESNVKFERNDGHLNLSGFFFQVRKHISRQISTHLDDQPAQFLIAILLGEKEGLSPEIQADFQNSGVAHVLAISGLHVGFVVLIIMLIFSFLPVSFRWQNVLTIIFLVFYVFLTGANPPVVRASIMVTIFLWGINLTRSPNIYNTVYSAGFIILLIQPQQLFWVGFQFSFIAVLSILFFYQKLKVWEEKWLIKFKDSAQLHHLRHWILTPFLVSLSAQLGTIPLMIFYFHKLPLISFILNIVVIPIVGLIVPIGFLVILASYFSFYLVTALAGLLSQLVNFLITGVHFAANLPYAYINLPNLNVLIIGVYLLGLGILFYWQEEKLHQFRIPAIVLSLLLILFIFAPKKHIPQIIMLDVGQGDATLVTTRSEQQLLFDAGPVYHNQDSGKDVIFPMLQVLGKLHLDKIIITHPHSDHFGGIFSLTQLVTIDSVYLPFIQISYPDQDSLVKYLAEKNIPVRFLRMGDQIPVDNSTRIFTLAPFSQHCKPMGVSGNEINNTSIVTLVKIEDSALLITGDAEVPVEQKLHGWGSLINTDILKVGHHGSSTSSSESFLEQISPAMAMIPVGRKNRFHHPSKKILARLTNLGINYTRSDIDGSVWLIYRQNKWIRLNWRKNRSF
ncbi:MAG: DNA internalization-related competence protein ComEC/Rec2 [Calditrichota bacterium]